MARLLSGLARMREGLGLATAKNKTGEEFFAELERGLVLADTGTRTAASLTARTRANANGSDDLAVLGDAVRKAVGESLARLQAPPVPWATKPHVITLLGTNGGGKTTTTAKLAKLACADGKSVVLAAADTYRAAATEQLRALAGRLGDKVRVVAGDKNPGAVAYNAVEAAVSTDADLVLIDTAGRQPTSKALMAEAAKIVKATAKAMAGTPHEKVLAIDANTGQNALRQVEAFDAELGLSSFVLTKLDGNARGGVILAIAETHPVPLKFVGVGEQVDDLVPFDANGFVQALFA